MQTLKSLYDVEGLVSDLVSAIVFVSPTHVIYEASSASVADACVELLAEHSAYSITKNGRWFVSVPLEVSVQVPLAARCG